MLLILDGLEFTSFYLVLSPEFGNHVNEVSVIKHSGLVLVLGLNSSCLLSLVEDLNTVL